MNNRPGIMARWLYPELSLFPTPESRKIGWRAARKVILASPRYWLGSILSSILFITVIINIGKLVPLRGVVDALLFSITLTAVHSVVLFSLIVPLAAVRRRLREALVEIDIPICIQCSYSLIGNVSGKCPECGYVIPEKLRSVIAKCGDSPS